jgi:hypothetical protein
MDSWVRQLFHIALFLLLLSFLRRGVRGASRYAEVLLTYFSADVLYLSLLFLLLLDEEEERDNMIFFFGKNPATILLLDSSLPLLLNPSP